MNPFRQEHILQRFGQTDCVAAMDNGSSRHERVVARPREASSEALTLAAG